MLKRNRAEILTQIFWIKTQTLNHITTHRLKIIEKEELYAVSLKNQNHKAAFPNSY